MKHLRQLFMPILALTGFVFLVVPIQAQLFVPSGTGGISNSTNNNFGLDEQPNLYTKLRIRAGDLTGGGNNQRTGIFASTTFSTTSNSRITGRVNSHFAEYTDWNSYTFAVGMRGQLNISEFIRSDASSFPYSGGGVFSVAPDPSLSIQGASQKYLGGSIGVLESGSISRTNGASTANSVISAVIGLNKNSSANTYAGYFSGNTLVETSRGDVSIGNSGSGFFSSTMRVQADNAGFAIEAYNLQNPGSRGIYSQAQEVGVYGEAYSFLGNNVTNSIGVWGVSIGNTGQAVEAGVHADALGGANSIRGVWGFALSGPQETAGGYFEVQAASNGAFQYGVFADGGGATGSAAAYFNGDINGVGSFNYTSDRKFKEDITDLANPLATIQSLKARSYSFTESKQYENLHFPKGVRPGFIAQEIEEVLPALVKDTRHPAHYDKEGKLLHEAVEYKSVDYVSLVPYLVGAMQEQQDQIESLQEEVQQLRRALNGQAPVSPTTGSDDRFDLGFQLDQNRPNPFHEESVVGYKLAEGTRQAAILIYDLSGRPIKRFDLDVNLRQGQISIQGSSMAAGSYFYTLIADGQEIASKKMILTSY